MREVIISINTLFSGRGLALLLSTPLLILSACSSGGDGGTAPATRNCDAVKNVGILTSDEGGSCEGSQDCTPISCSCNDGTSTGSLRVCINNVCSAKAQCARGCATHGGEKSSSGGTAGAGGGGTTTGTGATTGAGATTGGAAAPAPCTPTTDKKKEGSTTGATTGATTGGATTGVTTGGPPAPMCNGDWTLGEVFNVSQDPEQIGAACNANIPTNCYDGLFIKAPSGGCTCLVKCSSFKSVGVGDACTSDGKWKCQKIQATNASANSATACVPAAMNLCTAN